MTIEQANAVNVVVQSLIDALGGQGVDVDSTTVNAAALLADKAHKVLMAGLTGDQVREALQ